MFPPWSQHAPSVTCTGHESNGSVTGDPSQQSAFRPPLAEPRPSLHTRLTDTTSRLGLQDSRPYHDYRHPENHTRGQKLPALRDVLSQEYSPLSTSRAAPRHSDASSSTKQHITKDPYHADGFHPPMVLPSPPLTDQRHWLESQIRFGISGVSDNRHPQSIPSTSYTGYPDPLRRFTDIPLDRAPDTGAVPHPINGTDPNHNDQAPPEEASSRLPPRTPRHSHQPSGADSHGKYLRVEEVPGEGEFYVYEDGHRIPTSVDGEQVNPNWGLTKANKPRKRLATACLDCREKKIKCEPGLNSCVQCEKAMRPCRK